MVAKSRDETATRYELRRRPIGGGPARCAVFRRTYDAVIDDVWDACTDPARLRRWYAPVEGDLTLGGTFTQGPLGTGRVVACDAPRLLTVELGDAVPTTDEIELRLRAVDGGTELEFEHATTRDGQEVDGHIFDAVHCMGGGYGPRLLTLEEHLRGDLPPGLDPATLHLVPEYRLAIDVAMASLDELLSTDNTAADRPGQD